MSSNRTDAKTIAAVLFFMPEFINHTDAQFPASCSMELQEDYRITGVDVVGV